MPITAILASSISGQCFFFLHILHRVIELGVFMRHIKLYCFSYRDTAIKANVMYACWHRDRLTNNVSHEICGCLHWCYF